MNTHTRTSDSDLATLTDDAKTLLSDTADVAGDGVAAARRRLTAAMDSARDIAGQVRDRTVKNCQGRGQSRARKSLQSPRHRRRSRGDPRLYHHPSPLAQWRLSGLVFSHGEHSGRFNHRGTEVCEWKPDQQQVLFTFRTVTFTCFLPFSVPLCLCGKNCRNPTK